MASIRRILSTCPDCGVVGGVVVVASQLKLGGCPAVEASDDLKVKNQPPVEFEIDSNASFTAASSASCRSRSGSLVCVHSSSAVSAWDTSMFIIRVLSSTWSALFRSYAETTSLVALVAFDAFSSAVLSLWRTPSIRPSSVSLVHRCENDSHLPIEASAR